MYTQNKSGRAPARSGSRNFSKKPGAGGGSGSYRGRSKPYAGGRSGGRNRPRTAPGAYNGPHKRRGGAGRKLPSFDPSRFINTQPVDVAEVVYEAKNTFETFGLNQRLVSIIHELGITKPTPIQDQIIPEIMNGRDVVGLAETGTGKTAAFLVPLIEKSLQDNGRETLILTPTRELALQIQQELRGLSRGLRLFSVTGVGGAPIRGQINAVRRPNHFVIGTPGRILDLMKRKALNTSHMSTVVLDEADRMLDMGFITDIRAILSATPKERETLFFSATFDEKTKQLANDFLKDPVMVSVKKQDVTNSIAQDVVMYEQHSKFNTLTTLLENPACSRIIIFGSMKHSVQKLAEELTEHGIRSESIHGNKSHSQRQRALKRFKDGDVRVLVATDVAARGIHVDDISHVINYDLPGTFEDYVHRIGRTGRGSKRGKALTFVPKRSY